MEFNYLGENFKASTNVVSDFDTTGMRLIRDKETISDDLIMFDMSKQDNVTIRDMLHATMLKKVATFSLDAYDPTIRNIALDVFCCDILELVALIWKYEHSDTDIDFKEVITRLVDFDNNHVRTIMGGYEGIKFVIKKDCLMKEMEKRAQQKEEYNEA